MEKIVLKASSRFDTEKENASTTTLLNAQDALSSHYSPLTPHNLTSVSSYGVYNGEWNQSEHTKKLLSTFDLLVVNPHAKGLK